MKRQKHARARTRFPFLILLCATVIVVVPTVLLISRLKDRKPAKAEPVTTTAAVTTEPSATTTHTTRAVITEPVTTTEPTTTIGTVHISSGGTTTLPDASAKVSFPNTLFIGDSRTVGLMEYGKISDADFFCSVGMSVYKVRKETVSVTGVGKVTLDELLAKKQYDAIYLMLGINELGYGLENTANKYKEVADSLLEKQPNAKVILESTLHITQACNDDTSKSKAIFTNARINDFNARVAALADNQRLFYLDINPALDDENGCLTADFAAKDGIHIRAKYYLLWRKYLDEHRL